MTTPYSTGTDSPLVVNERGEGIYFRDEHITLSRTERGNVRAACAHCGSRDIFDDHTITEAIAHVKRTSWHHDCR